MRNFKCGRCKKVNELVVWNKHSKVNEMNFPFTLQDMNDNEALEKIKGNITFKCPSCNQRMSVVEINEIL